MTRPEAAGCANITDIEGVGDVYGAKLKDVGIASTEALLEAGKDPKGREELVEKTGIGHKQILDFSRARGLGSSPTQPEL